ncbi:hypothetical protein HYR99_05140 [Candidatus Poribacteria bacterium]|nr:hypothetical protein [Candidatus Poribacteria bacterium]
MDTKADLNPPDPDYGQDGSHSWNSHETVETAWIEGWANFYQSPVRNYWGYPNSEKYVESSWLVSLESDAPWPGQNMEDVEGAVAAILWDIFDSTSDAGDSISEGMGNIWYVFESYNPPNEHNHPWTIHEFWDGWFGRSGASNQQKWSVFYEHGVNKDNTAPGNPTSVSSSTHTPSQWSTNRIMSMSWSGASDNLSGVAGYSYLWDNSSNTNPDQTMETSGTSATSQSLGDANNWYFHIRTKDNAGNEASWTTLFVFIYSVPAVTRVLHVVSFNPYDGVNITVSPNDNDGKGNGTTSFTRIYNNNTVVTLTAPATANSNNFQKWQRNGVDYSSNQAITFPMDVDYTLTAVYVTPGTPQTTWNFNTDAEGWTGRNANISVSDGRLIIKPVNNDPGVVSPPLGNLTGYNAIEIQMASQASDTLVEIFYATSGSNFSEDKKATFTIVNDGGYRIYYRRLDQTAGWTGTITQLRIDPTKVGDGNAGIDYIKLYNETSAVTLNLELKNTTRPGNDNSYRPGDTKESRVHVTGRGYTVETYLQVTYPDGTQKYAYFPNTNPKPEDPLAFQTAKRSLTGVRWNLQNYDWLFNIYTFTQNDGEGTWTWKYWYEDFDRPEVIPASDTESYVFTKEPQVTRTLTVSSSNPNSGVNITVSPNDNDGKGNGTTQFTRIYNHTTVVTLTAPATVNSNNFQKWQRNGVDYLSNQTVNVTMDADYTLTAVYATPVETVSKPGTPSGELNPIVGVSYPYTTSGATSNLEHPVEYQFDWGDGNQSAWSTSKNAIHSWSSPGPKTVIVTARCQIHTDKTNTSNGLSVNVQRPTELVLKNIIVEIGKTEIWEALISIIVAGDGTFFTIVGDGVNGGNATFRAGSRIILKPGFHAQPGSQFNAQIDPTLK